MKKELTTRANDSDAGDQSQPQRSGTRRETMNRLEGKVIAITGASSGIGEATAKLLAQHGAHVLVGARRKERLDTLVQTIRAQGGSAEAEPLDVTRRADLERFV